MKTTVKTMCALLPVLAMCALPRAASGQVLSEIAQPPNGNNQRAEISQWIGLVKITIAYHSPHVHSPAGVDRKGHIWGELVHYGLFDDGFGPSTATPWRTGANESTTIAFSHDVKVNGHDVKAGTYALFLELKETGPWVWIFSNAIGWGGFQYDPKNDALRADATPVDAPYTEYLTFGFDERRPDSAVAFLQWENKRIPFRIDVPNVNDLYVAQLRQDLQSWAGFNYQNWQTAAQFCADHRVNLEEALVWADKAIHEPFRGATFGSEDFSTLSTRAAVLHALNRDAEADQTMDRAIRLNGADVFPVYVYGMRLLAAGRKEKALEIFTFNRRQHPDEPFWTYLGLARGYTAVGDKPNAIASWEAALLHVHASQQRNVAAFRQALAALRESK
jgi:tetratricopeptide (TPR) repeat protein